MKKILTLSLSVLSAICSIQGQERSCEAGEQFCYLSEMGITPLMIAARDGQFYTVRALLDEGANPNVQAKDGETALLKASVSGHLDVVQLLLERGAHTELRENGGYTPLIAALNSRHGEVAKALINAGAKVPEYFKDQQYFNSLFPNKN